MWMMHDYEKFNYSSYNYSKLFCKRLIRKLFPMIGSKRRIENLKDLLKMNCETIQKLDKRLEDISVKLRDFGDITGYDPDKCYVLTDPKAIEIENIIYDILDIIHRPEIDNDRS